MPLSMTLRGANNSPAITPCLDGKELLVDSELVNTGLCAISVKGYDSGDPRQETGIRHRNSFWSVHRPELSKLNWAAHHTPRNIEKYLKIHAGNQKFSDDAMNSVIPPADSSQLTVIHTTVDQRSHADEDYIVISKPRTMQYSDDDLASYTTLHKSRAEFCVTIGHMGEHFAYDNSEPCSSEAEDKCGEGCNVCNGKSALNNMRMQLNGARIETVFPAEQVDPTKIQNTETWKEQETDAIIPSASQDMLIALMDENILTTPCIKNNNSLL